MYELIDDAGVTLKIADELAGVTAPIGSAATKKRSRTRRSRASSA
jgi:hypothetical protein